MKIYDVTVAISESVPIYKGDPEVVIESSKELATDGANVSSLCFGAHTGTHVDAPNHFIDGTRRIDDLLCRRFRDVRKIRSKTVFGRTPKIRISRLEQ
jgi:kynurenine formamidase